MDSPKNIPVQVHGAFIVVFALFGPASLRPSQGIVLRYLPLLHPGT
jgi:hypothetical protein